MNRTGIILAAAGGLALLALILGLPRIHPGGGGTTVINVDPQGPATAQDGSIKMVTRLSHPYVPTGRSDLFVTVDLAGVDVPGSDRSAVNLVLVIDRSGSMSGFKLTQAKDAAKQLVSQLKGADRLAIVHYGSDVKSLASQLATAENKERMLQYIDGIWDDGGTNIGAGLAEARDHLLATKSDFKVNRIILISDGQPTEGMTDPAGLTQLTREIRQHGVSISSIGVGTDFNEDLMQAIAEVGAGAYGYLADASQLASIFSKDLMQAGTMVARNVTLTFELPAGVELGEVLGYRANQVGRTVKVPMVDFSAGQVERLVARLTVSGDTAGKAIDVSAVKLEYTDLLANKAVASAARLSAMTTDSQDEVLTRRDKEATVYAARAQSAWNVSQAAESMKNGDREKAQLLIQGNARFLDEAALIAGEAEVAEDKKQMQQISDSFGQAGDEAGVQNSVKAAKRDAAKGFGRLGSTY